MSGKKNYTVEEVLQHVFADPDSDNNENSDSEEDDSSSGSTDESDVEQGNTSNYFSVSPLPNNSVRSNLDCISEDCRQLHLR